MLLAILDQNPDLEGTVYQIAKQILCDISSEDIMNDVYNVLNMLDVEELYRRSGKTRYGYVEPPEESGLCLKKRLSHISMK